MNRQQAEAAANAHFGLTFCLGEEQWFRVVEWCDNGDINPWPEETEDKAKRRINRLRKAYVEALLDPTGVERKAYRTWLRRHINGHKGIGPHNRAATHTEKRLRAHDEWLCKAKTPIDREWSIDEIIDRLVNLRYPLEGKPE